MVLVPRSSVLVLLYVFLSVVVCPAAPGTLFIYTFMCWFYLMFCYVLVCHAPRTVFIYFCVCCFYYVVLCMWVFACCSLPCPWYRGPLHLLLAICYGSCGFIACFFACCSLPCPWYRVPLHFLRAVWYRGYPHLYVHVFFVCCSLPTLPTVDTATFAC